MRVYEEAYLIITFDLRINDMPDVLSDDGNTQIDARYRTAERGGRNGKEMLEGCDLPVFYEAYDMNEELGAPLYL